MILKKFNLLFRLISIIVILCMMSACANNGGKPNIETPVVEETDAITALIEDLNNDAAEDRAAAVKALGVINNPETYNYIITALTDEQEIVRDQAKQTIRTLGTRVIDPLIFMLDTNDNELRQELMAILEEIGPPAYPSLIKALSNQNEKIKSSVYEIMVNLGEPIIQDLINSFSVEDEERNYLIRECRFTLHIGQ